jgi:DNA-binding LacI/PurR family transcriptional regulator
MATGTTRSVSATDRLAGVRETLEHRGLAPKPEWFIPYSSFEGYVAGVKNLLHGPEPPTGLVVWYDELAIRLMNRLQGEGFQVPGDVSIVGFDSLGPAEAASPSLTSVHQPVMQMAFEAALMLISLVRGEPLAARERVFQPRLDVRSSTCPCQ